MWNESVGCLDGEGEPTAAGAMMNRHSWELTVLTVHSVKREKGGANLCGICCYLQRFLTSCFGDNALVFDSHLHDLGTPPELNTIILNIRLLVCILTAMPT